MKTETKNLAHPAIVEQVTRNTTSWIGHRIIDNKDFIAGQTFVVPEEGDLEAIEIFPSIVTRPGKLVMSIHNFDPLENHWGPALGKSSIDINGKETGQWLAFNLHGMHLHKGRAYGFRLESPDAYIGVAEAAGSHQMPPYEAGREWSFAKNQNSEKSFSYFSLAFKVDMRA